MHILSLLTSHGVQLLDDVIILVCCIVVFLAFKRDGKIWGILALSLTIIIFSIPLLHLWKSAESNYNLILGLLPWSDASGYYSDTINLTAGRLLGSFAGDRPLFPALLSFLLWLTAENLKITLLLITIINALATFILACRVRDYFGPLSGTGLLYLLQFFYRLFTGTTLTEQLGIPLGLIGIVYLLSGVKQKKTLSFATGFFLCMLGLLARPGAFLIIPSLFVFGLITFNNDKKVSAKAVIIFFCAIAIPWLINSGLRNSIAVKQSVPFGRYSYTIYAQAVGSDNWKQILYDHPELIGLNEPKFSNEIYRIAFLEIAHNPFRLVSSSLKAWRDLFFSTSYGIFSYLQFENQIVTIIVQLMAILFLLIGLLFCWLNRQNELYTFLLAAFGGIILSAPFAPPVNTLWMRAYATTISIPVLLACIGASTIVQKWDIYLPSTASWLPKFELFKNGFSLTLVLMALGGSLMIRAFAQPEAILKFSCPPNSIPVQFKLVSGAFISIVTNESGQSTNIPIVAARDFRKSMREFPGVDSNFSLSLIENITPPVLLTYTYNHLTNDSVWLIAPANLSAYTGKVILGCGKTISPNSSVVEIQSAQVIP